MYFQSNPACPATTDDFDFIGESFGGQLFCPEQDDIQFILISMTATVRLAEADVGTGDQAVSY